MRGSVTWAGQATQTECRADPRQGKTASLPKATKIAKPCDENPNKHRILAVGATMGQRKICI
jgi:hypothetical protein